LLKISKKHQVVDAELIIIVSSQKFYEQKQYKKGLKAAESVLKKFPQHGGEYPAQPSARAISHLERAILEALSVSANPILIRARFAETLAMKGLTINCMGADKKEEAYNLVKEVLRRGPVTARLPLPMTKPLNRTLASPRFRTILLTGRAALFPLKGIKYDMKSHVCWHVYGLLYRSDRLYKDAIKCYRQALKLDKDNLQILRDLSLLQIHTRDLKGYLSTRFELLQLKSGQKTNWISYAVANHLMGKHGTACKVIESYQKQDDHDPPYETAEMIQYKMSIVEEQGNHEEALSILDTNWDKIVDKLGAREKRASFLLALGREEARGSYEKLIERNVENLAYHVGLQATYGFDDNNSELAEAQEVQLLELYHSLQKKHPRANACKRLPLDFCTGDRFATAADLYIRKKLRSGIPSLYSDLLSFYKSDSAKDKTKIEQLGQLQETMLAALVSTGKFPVSVAEPVPKEESPMVLMWLWKLLANHYERIGEPVKAIQFINKAIDHTPSCIELYMCKARIYKHHGNTKAAACCMEKARSMDLADRSINTRAVVYLLRNGEIEKATKTVELFTREADACNLYEMQAMWWAIECGRAYKAQGIKSLGPALKKLTAVEKHFVDFVEDQFDFHSYCLRKMTLRTYIDMLRNADKIRDSANFVKAAEGVIECYLSLHAMGPSAEGGEYAGMSDKEVKKAKAKKAKAEARVKEEAAKAAKGKGKGKAAKKPAKEEEKKDGEEEEKKKEKPKKEDKKEADADPNGIELLNKQPLEECLVYVDLLQKYNPTLLKTHILSYDVYKAMEAPLACIKALRNAAKIDPTAPELHSRMCEFFHAVDAGTLKLSPIATEVVAELRQDAELLAGKSLKQYNQAYTAASAGSAPRRAAAAVGANTIGACGEADLVKTLQDTSGEGFTRAQAEACCTRLEALDQAAAGAFKAACAPLFPLASFFNPAVLDEEVAFLPDSLWKDMEAENGETEQPTM